MDLRILKCDCTNEKRLVDCDRRYQHQFDLKEVCCACYPDLYEKSQSPAAGDGK